MQRARTGPYSYAITHHRGKATQFPKPHLARAPHGNLLSNQEPDQRIIAWAVHDQAGRLTGRWSELT